MPASYIASCLQLARARLHISVVPSSLPCREAEYEELWSRLTEAVSQETGTCLYISGTPGTGKTATVKEVLANLTSAVQSNELQDFTFVEINGLRIADAHQAYCLLWHSLKGQKVTPSQAVDLLNQEFNKPSPRRGPCIVLMDELDQLVTKNQSLMYNFFSWPGLPHSKLIVIGVANTMDLPERTLSNKVSSRLGLTRITFPGYTHHQLIEIVQARLQDIPNDTIERDAIEFASRKIAAVSGDARRALDICRRAIEIAESTVNGPNSTLHPTRQRSVGSKATATPKGKGRVTVACVKKAISEATSSPVQRHIRGLPLWSKVILASLLSRHRSGHMEVTLGEAMVEVERTCVQFVQLHSANLGLVGSKGHGRKDSGATFDPKVFGLVAHLQELAGLGLILMEGRNGERSSKLKIAVGLSEVQMALLADDELTSFGIAVSAE